MWVCEQKTRMGMTYGWQWWAITPLHEVLELSSGRPPLPGRHPPTMGGPHCAYCCCCEPGGSNSHGCPTSAFDRAHKRHKQQRRLDRHSSHETGRPLPQYEWKRACKNVGGHEQPCDETDLDLFYASTVITIGNGAQALFWDSHWLNASQPKDTALLVYEASTRCVRPWRMRAWLFQN